jgi:putative ABC transport system ATP-binding protein
LAASDATNKTDNTDNKTRFNMTMIEVEGLGKDVQSGDGSLTILHDISFRVSAGEAVAVVGASGSGKTTLLSLMAGLDSPTRGHVRLAGEAMSALDEDARAALRGRLLGFVFQSFQLLPALTALENAALPLELMGRADANRQAEAMLSRVGLGERLHHYPKHLSGGEQQRVALARAFAVEPKLLMADEPTGNLDATTGAEIIELMFAMNREAGTTLVLVTHDEALAARCGRVLRLAAGRLQH